VAVSAAIARRYAQAYFDLAVAADAVDTWGEELASAAADLGSPEVARALDNPRLSAPRRSEMALAVLDGKSTQMRNLVRLLLERGRIAVLDQVAAEYRRLADRASGVVRAEVVSAVPLDAASTKRLRGALSERLGGEVETTVRQDPDILGGLIVRIGDRVIDASVRTRLEQLRSALV
jgi:F-type H+-transporting ATPase subunit delta